MTTDEFERKLSHLVTEDDAAQERRDRKAGRRVAVLNRGRPLGVIPATGDQWFALDGAVYLITPRYAIEYGDYFDWCRKVRAGKWQFRPLRQGAG